MTVLMFSSQRRDILYEHLLKGDELKSEGEPDTMIASFFCTRKGANLWMNKCPISDKQRSGYLFLTTRYLSSMERMARATFL
jgi:hypothetical protein